MRKLPCVYCICFIRLHWMLRWPENFEEYIRLHGYLLEGGLLLIVKDGFKQSAFPVLNESNSPRIIVPVMLQQHVVVVLSRKIEQARKEEDLHVYTSMERE